MHIISVLPVGNDSNNTFIYSVKFHYPKGSQEQKALTLKVLITTVDAQWEGMGDVGSARYELALLPPCPTIRVLSYSN